VLQRIGDRDFGVVAFGMRICNDTTHCAKVRRQRAVRSDKEALGGKRDGAVPVDGGRPEGEPVWSRPARHAALVASGRWQGSQEP
jgi:hypothetical protein